MANRKTACWWAASIHALVYGLPWLILVTGWEQWVVIVVTHAVIDRYQLAAYWCRFWGVGEVGWLLDKVLTACGWRWMSRKVSGRTSLVEIMGGELTLVEERGPAGSSSLKVAEKPVYDHMNDFLNRLLSPVQFDRGAPQASSGCRCPMAQSNACSPISLSTRWTVLDIFTAPRKMPSRSNGGD